MKNETNWKLANYIASRILLCISITIFITHLIAYLLIPKEFEIVVIPLICCDLIMVLMMIPITEIVLKKSKE